MPQANNSAKEQLQKLEKLAKRIIRKSLKNNTLSYTVQISLSSESDGLKYSSFISSPNKGVQPIIFSFDSYELLEAALKEAEQSYNPLEVEKAFHEDRINTYKAQIDQHQARVDQLNDPNYTPEDDIEMEEVALESDNS